MFSSNLDRLKTPFLCLSWLLLSLFSFSLHAQPPRVLATIKPIHSLLSQLTKNVTDADLLLDNTTSAHHFQLRPSQIRKLQQAQLVFYSSNAIESFIPSLKQQHTSQQFIELASISGLHTLAVRELHSHGDNDQHKEDIDGHIWLSINNAKQISRHITKLLVSHDPKNTARYQQNLDKLLARLSTLKTSNQALLAPVRQKAFLVYHDAYQYFEQENHLSQAYFITSGPEHLPGIKRVRELKRLIQQQNIQCIFYEPPTIPALVDTLTEGSTIRLAALDPMGAQLQSGEQHYFQLMQQTAQSIYDCLK